MQINIEASLTIPYFLVRERKEKTTHNADNGCLGDFGRGRTHIAAILVGEVL